MNKLSVIMQDLLNGETIVLEKGRLHGIVLNFDEIWLNQEGKFMRKYWVGENDFNTKEITDYKALQILLGLF